VRAKICGITNLEDALLSVESGADALGFLFYKKSPRYIEPLEVKKIVEQLPPFVERVGLFVNEDAETINRISRESGISTIQLHFETENFPVEKLELPYIRVIRAEKEADLELYSDEYRIVDAFVEEYGGAGKRVNPDWFRGKENSKLILAGGLTPDNLHEIADFGFYGVDVSSGVEAEKGKKSAEKVKKFLQVAKEF
jgi:phosphoribosylanthranilate isomerase